VYAFAYPEVMSFNEWHDIFGHDANAYSHKKTIESRERAFMANIKKIQAHNAKNLSWRMGVNQFSDLSGEEFNELMKFAQCRKIMNMTQRGEKPKDRLPQMRNPKNMASVDWRTSSNPIQKVAVTAVKNQGQCGSCWSFSASGAVEGAWAVGGNTLVSLSEQELVSCDKQDSACDGGLMDFAFDFVKDNGLTSEANYPYVSGNGQVPECNEEKRAQKVATIKSYTDVQHSSEDALENALNIGPVAIAIEADQDSFQYYTSGVMTGECGSSLDHGVLAVGYGHDKDSNLDYWIVKNSWGPSWGMDGYILLERHISSSAGQCGILMQPSYPVSGAALPTPKPTPSPGPTPGTNHYEDPEVAGTCNNDETEVVNPYGQNGRMCMPPCETDSDCPAAPADWDISPSCILPYGETMLCGFNCLKEICAGGTVCTDILGIVYICMYH